MRKDSVGTARAYFLWSGDHLLAELNSSATTKTAEYAYYPGMDNPQALILGQAIYRARLDGLSNVIALTDTAGLIQRTYAYDDWGLLTSGSDTGGFNGRDRMRWKGALWAGPEAELYFMRNRWYEPATGRFLSEDPIGLAGGMNLFAYSHSDPVGGRDPLGLQAQRMPDLESNVPWTANTFPWGYDSDLTGELLRYGRGTLKGRRGPGPTPKPTPQSGKTCGGWGTNWPRQSDIVTLANPIETYHSIGAVRLTYDRLFPGEGQSAPRHVHASYELTRRYGPFLTFEVGLLNEVRGLIYDIRMRLQGRTSRAFELADIVNNTRGVLAAMVRACPHPN